MARISDIFCTPLKATPMSMYSKIEIYRVVDSVAQNLNFVLLGGSKWPENLGILLGGPKWPKIWASVAFLNTQKELQRGYKWSFMCIQWKHFKKIAKNMHFDLSWSNSGPKYGPKMWPTGDTFHIQYPQYACKPCSCWWKLRKTSKGRVSAYL